MILVVALSSIVRLLDLSLGDELLGREILDTLLEAQVLIERWRREHNQIHPHSA